MSKKGHRRNFLIFPQPFKYTLPSFCDFIKDNLLADFNRQTYTTKLKVPAPSNGGPYPRYLIFFVLKRLILSLYQAVVKQLAIYELILISTLLLWLRIPRW